MFSTKPVHRGVAVWCIAWCLAGAGKTTVAQTAPAFSSQAQLVELVVVSTGDEADTERRKLHGKITQLKKLEGGVVRVSVAGTRQTFQVALPAKLPMPLRRGDTITADLWVDGAKLHARIVDAQGKPLIFMNELPADWSITTGARCQTGHRPPRWEHNIRLETPSTEPQEFRGYVFGTVAGDSYWIEGSAATIDVADAKQKGLTPTWTSSQWFAVVRKR